MFLSAVPIVKIVMVGLAFASLATWTVWLAKTIELWRARRSARRGLEVLASAKSLRAAERELAQTRSPVARFVAAAAGEAGRSNGLAAEGVKDRAATLLSRIEAQAGRAIARGIGVLATIGATAPFVGLFGTVWGIMDSFIGISKTNTTNLAVVAPGIAEALLATAMGLVAAIPAVVMYNAFAHAITGYRAQLGDAAAEVLRHLSRDLDREAMVAADGPWAKRLVPIAKTRPMFGALDLYYQLLTPVCSKIDIWQTTYVHPLDGPDDIVDWFEGSGLRPFLEPLSPCEHEAFLSRYRAELSAAYPKQPDGKVLLRYPRLFFVAQK